MPSCHPCQVTSFNTCNCTPDKSCLMATSIVHDLASISLKRAGLLHAFCLPGPSTGRSAIHPSISDSRHTGSGNIPSFIRSSIHCWDMLIFSATRFASSKYCILYLPNACLQKGTRLIRMMLADQSYMRLRGFLRTAAVAHWVILAQWSRPFFEVRFL